VQASPVFWDVDGHGVVALLKRLEVDSHSPPIALLHGDVDGEFG